MIANARTNFPPSACNAAPGRVALALRKVRAPTTLAIVADIGLRNPLNSNGYGAISQARGMLG
jgi:hypothetical protein